MNATTYYWRAGAKNAGGVSGWAAAWSFTTVVAAPAMPTLASPANGATNQPLTNLTLSWNSVPGAASYTLQGSTDAGFATVIGPMSRYYRDL